MKKTLAFAGISAMALLGLAAPAGANDHKPADGPGVVKGPTGQLGGGQPGGGNPGGGNPGGDNPGGNPGGDNPGGGQPGGGNPGGGQPGGGNPGGDNPGGDNPGGGQPGGGNPGGDNPGGDNPGGDNPGGGQPGGGNPGGGQPGGGNPGGGQPGGDNPGGGQPGGDNPGGGQPGGGQPGGDNPGGGQPGGDNPGGGNPGGGNPGGDNSGGGKDDDKEHKVTLCHRTGSATNPYVIITVDYHAVTGEGHDGHDQVGNGPVGDIIPPFTIKGVTYAGKNWPRGEATLNNGCVPHVPVEPVVPLTPGEQVESPVSKQGGNVAERVSGPVVAAPGAGVGAARGFNSQTAASASSAPDSTAVLGGLALLTGAAGLAFYRRQAIRSNTN